MSVYDHIVVGSGLNSLVCSALLAKKGKKVLLLEREQKLGGCIKTERELFPGFIVDLMSISHVQFVTSPAFEALKADLTAAGLEYCVNDKPTGVVMPDGRSLVLSTKMEENFARIGGLSEHDAKAFGAMLEAFGQNQEIIFTLLGNETLSYPVLKTLIKACYQRGVRKVAILFRELLVVARQWLNNDFQSPELKALIAPMSLHAGLGPEVNMSAFMGKLITLSLLMAGDPMVKGGSDNLVKAFEKVIKGFGGDIKTGADVEEVVIVNKVANGVKLKDGSSFKANASVICNVTPKQLYQRLVPDNATPESVTPQDHDFHYGRSGMIIHLPLKEKPNWVNPELAEVAFLHVTDGIDSVSKAVNEAERGMIPEQGTLCVVQPAAVDPSRVPEGKSLLWVQISDLPQHIKGDAAGLIAIPENGQWDEQTSNAYAERVIAQLEKVMPGLSDLIEDRFILSPDKLEAMNINLVNGDPYSGHCGLDQSLLFRSAAGFAKHRTGIKNLFHIGASSHPGPGLGGMSGFLVANQLA
jgi:phytoene dehydrogenase-like protein